MKLRLFLLALACLFTISVARADDAPTPPPVLDALRASGAQLFYLGKYDTLDGWVVVRSGKPEFYYATPGGNAIVLGVLFDKDGKMLTADQMTALQEAQKTDLRNMVQSPEGAIPAPAAAAPDATPATPAAPAVISAPAAITPAVPTATVPAANNPAVTPVPSNSPSEQLMAAMQGAAALVWGQPGAPAFYAFMDPTCPHCQRFLREVEPFVTSGRVSVHMVMLGFTDTTMKQAAFLLATADGADRMLRYAKGDTSAIEAGSPDTTAVQNNLNLFNKWDLDGTPIILYRAGTDQKIRLVRGRPLDVTAVVNDLSPAK